MKRESFSSAWFNLPRSKMRSRRDRHEVEIEVPRRAANRNESHCMHERRQTCERDECAARERRVSIPEHGFSSRSPGRERTIGNAAASRIAPLHVARRIAQRRIAQSGAKHPMKSRARECAMRVRDRRSGLRGARELLHPQRRARSPISGGASVTDPPRAARSAGRRG
jgi:hypothetical protein